MRRLCVVLVLVAVGMAAGSSTAQAATCNFTGLSGGDWDSPFNWDCGKRPTAADLVVIDAGDTVSITSAQEAGALTIAGGTVQLAGGSLTVHGSTQVSSGAVTGAGTLTLDGATTKSTTGTWVIRSGPQVQINAASTHSDGQVCIDDASNTTDPVVGVNAAWTMSGSASLDCSSGLQTPALRVSAAGSLLAADTGTKSISAPVRNAGTITVATNQQFAFASGLTQTGGLTQVASGGSLTGDVVLEGGTLRGGGTAGGDVANTGGTVAPGASPGKLTIGGNYTQGAGGTLAVEIAGTTQDTQYDRLAVNGTTTLDGTLAIANDPGFTPAPSDTFEVLTATGSASGTFSSLTGATVSSGTYVPQYAAGPPGKVTLAIPTAPSNNVAPSIPSTAKPGDTLTCDPGDWTGSPTFAYDWLRDGAPIVGQTGNRYTVADGDVGRQIRCRVTATNGGGSTQALSNTVAPAVPSPTQPSPPPPAPPAPPPANETIRGEKAFKEGTSNDLLLACTKLDVLLIDVLPAGRRVSVTGTADVRLVGRTALILLDGRRVGSARIKADGSFATRVKAPPKRKRRSARYQARVGSERSQRLVLERRMVATTLTRRGNHLVFRGRITPPFARKPAVVEVERFLSCRRRERIRTARVVPDRRGTFVVRFPAPNGVKAGLYRTRTKVALRRGGTATERTFTLRRAIDLLP